MVWHKENPCRLENFTLAVALLNKAIPESHFCIQNVYFDYGADLRWDTIIRYKDKSDMKKMFNDYQILSPREWEAIDLASTEKDVVAATDAVIQRIKQTGY
jgi:hypothetical protein